MTRIPLSSGDLIDVEITRALPFGALVASGSGVPGLVRGAVSAGIGATLRVQVVDVDEAEQRFSARPA